MGTHRGIRSFAAAVLTAALSLVVLGSRNSAASDEPRPARIEEKLVFLPLPIPILAYVARPLIDGPLRLVVMNHGESLDPTSATTYDEALQEKNGGADPERPDRQN